MKCDKCRYVEMKMKEVKDDNMIFRCKQCGNEEIIEIQKVEKMADEKKNK